jgi:hypothetical protein
MDVSKTIPEKDFFTHVFNFNDGGKSVLFNSIQYLILAFIPILIVNHLINKVFSELGSGDKIDEYHISSIQLLAEIFAQLILSICLVFIINNFVTFFSTYSGTEYTSLNMVNLVFMLLPVDETVDGYIIGNKIRVLIDRFNTIVFEDEVSVHKKGTPHVTITQPISKHPSQQNNIPDYAPRQPTQQIHQKQQKQQTQQMQQTHQQPPQQHGTGASNQMYGGPTTKLVNAEFGIDNSHHENFDLMGGDTTLISALSSLPETISSTFSPTLPSNSPGSGEPCAANDVLGGSFGSSF